jgi:hypothetical protein
MTRYFLDLSDDEGFALDDEGIELVGLDEAVKEASRALSDAARDVLMRPAAPSFVAVDIRDHLGIVMHIRFTIDVKVMRQN